LRTNRHRQAFVKISVSDNRHPAPLQTRHRVISYWPMGATKPNRNERAFSGVSFRTDSELESRLDAVASTAQLSRARVAKLCVIRGLERLEEELALTVKATTK
jgi:predicted DNA-binding protein